MPCLRCSACALCRTANTSLTGIGVSSGNVPSTKWVFHHIPGTRQFSLFSNAINNAKVSVHCTLPAPLTRRRPKRVRTQLPAKSEHECGTLPFTCQISNLCRGFPLVLALRCETRADQLVITGASFTREAADLRQGPEAARNQLAYSGPYLTQVHLADIVIGARPLNSPLEKPLHEEALFFNSTYCFDNGSYNWFGHSPVHTVRAEVTELIAQVAESFGVDDDLAAYVSAKAKLVDKAEKAAWQQLFHDLFTKR
jgi:hypothetical protein